MDRIFVRRCCLASLADHVWYGQTILSCSISELIDVQPAGFHGTYSSLAHIRVYSAHCYVCSRQCDLEFDEVLELPFQSPDILCLSVTKETVQPGVIKNGNHAAASDMPNIARASAGVATGRPCCEHSSAVRRTSAAFEAARVSRSIRTLSSSPVRQ